MIAQAPAASETHFLFAWPLLDTVFLLFVGATLAWLIATGWARAVRLMWSAGLDPRHRMAHTNAPLRLLLGLAVVIIALGPLELGSTLTSAAFLGGGLVLLAIVGQSWLRDILGGIIIAANRPFTVGDSIATPTVTGRVIDLGLSRVRVELSDGSLVSLPARMVAAERLVTSGRAQALPAEVVLRLSADLDPGWAHAELFDQVRLSAYVDLNAPVIVEQTADGAIRVQATPISPDDTDALKNDVAARAATLLRPE